MMVTLFQVTKEREMVLSGQRWEGNVKTVSSRDQQVLRS